MFALLLYTLLSAAMFYLGSRAVITSFLWSRYPRRFASFMDCAACTGFWWGVSFACYFRFDVLGLDGRAETTPIFVGLCSIVLTPIAAGLMQRGLDSLGSAVADE